MLRRKRQRGSAMVEAALMAPWIFFLFVGVYDFGFYAWAMISTQSAARAAALAVAEAPTAGISPCTAALGELSMLLNGTGSCVATASVTASAPVGVDIASVAGPDGQASTQATVLYQTVQLIPIPGILMGKTQFRRVAQVRTIIP